LPDSTEQKDHKTKEESPEKKNYRRRVNAKKPPTSMAEADTVEQLEYIRDNDGFDSQQLGNFGRSWRGRWTGQDP
jgi:dienelactone hydrolase